MKKTLLLALALAAAPVVRAQTDAEILSKIIDVSSGISSFSCNFKQVRTVEMLQEPAVSTGRMQYRNGGKLLWEYITPSRYQITFIDNLVRVTRDGVSTDTALSENPVMGYLKDLLVGIMSGEQLSADDKFEVSVKEKSPLIMVEMVPLQRRMRKMFSVMSLHFTPSTCVISKVKLTEPDGSATEIIFSSIQAE